MCNKIAKLLCVFYKYSNIKQRKFLYLAVFRCVRKLVKGK